MNISTKENIGQGGKDVAVVVLNWNGLALLEQFAGNWAALTPSYATLIVVDNGSDDASVAYLRDKHPEIRLLAFDHNYGFAEGYNRAIAELDYPVVVLLNSDAVLHEGWLDEPMELFRTEPDVVAVQPKLRAFRRPESFEYAGAAGGYVDALGYPYCAGRLFDSVELDRHQYDQRRELMWATGACFIVRRSAYLEAGGLDADFFAHQEEIDLSWRLRARGGRILLAPSSIVYHVGGASLDAASPRKSYLNFRNNLLMLYKNMPLGRLLWVLPTRLVLDLVASVQMLVGGKRAHAGAVLRAWWDALCMMPSYRAKRRENLRQSRTPVAEILSPCSVVWQYFVRGRRSYSDLK